MNVFIVMSGSYPSQIFSAHKKTHQLDLHGFFLKDAIDEVQSKLVECKESGDKGLILIHGYRHGQTLKNYFRSKSFIKDMKNKDLTILHFDTSKPGSTSILLKKSDRT